MSIFGGIFDELLQPVVGLRSTEYTIVACAALLAYEYFLTLDREIYFVWGSQWSLGKVIFFLNRYSPIIDTTLAIYILTGVKDQRLCPALSTATAGAFVGGMFVSEIVLAMRTYAIWGGRRSILIFLVLFTLSVFAAASVLTHRFLESLTFVQIPAFLKPSLRIACAPLPARGQTGFEFMVFMINQAVVAILTLYRAMQQYRVENSPSTNHLSIFLVLSTANVAVALALPVSLDSLLSLTSREHDRYGSKVEWGVLMELPLRVISSICCTRVLLNIRGAYFTPNSTSETGLVVANKNFQYEQRSAEATGESSTLAYSGDDHFGLTKDTSTKWQWEDSAKPAPRLSLGRISPFQLNVSEIEVA
ncbi:hypothetical protein BU17DRAFT_83985 [Hysterangium stoloniferum]|nr:hypothetical protein BU17DRAFT_83985 [Hysterangium stoloniferum]